MANQECVDRLVNGVQGWNDWRNQHALSKEELDLSGVDFGQQVLEGAKTRRYANLSGVNLSKANLKEANLAGADLSHSDLSYGPVSRQMRMMGFPGRFVENWSCLGADLSRANLSGADLSNANLSAARLDGADLSHAKLEHAKLRYASLKEAQLSGAHLDGADLSRTMLEGSSLVDVLGTNADFAGSRLSRANLSGAFLPAANLSNAVVTDATLVRANLSEAILVRTDLTGSDLTSANIYGIAAWDVCLNGTQQHNLIISSEPLITVDNLEVAQFLYLLLNNEKLRQVIETITSKVVLILGRFTPNRKAILDAIRERLRNRGYLPVLFDFEKPATRDITETVSTLAHLARFVIADITDAKSIPQELDRIVPNLPSVPVQPLLLASQEEYGMFEHFRRYPWVLPVLLYQDQASLLQCLDSKAVEPAELKVRDQAAATKQ